MNIKKNHSKPKFSVIIGTYNCKKFLKIAILSVLKQSFKDFELIIVDDGSTDGSQKLIKELASKDKRIRFFFHKKNSGKDSVPKNFGIRKSRGKYICFLDSDDVWNPEKLQEQNSHLKDSTIMLCTSCEYINEKGKRYTGFFMHYFRKFLQKKFFSTGFVSFYMYNPVIFSSVLIKAKIIKKYMLNENSELVGIIDLELWLRIFKDEKNQSKITFINKDLVKIRRRSNSLNRDYRRASIRSMHCVSKSFIDRKDYKYFYVFIVGIALRSLKTLLNYSYYKIRKFLLLSLFLIIGFYAIIFQTPLLWNFGNYLIHYDKFERQDALVIISGNGGDKYINLEYQKRFLDIKKIITTYEYENIIILGREQEIDEVEILSALIESEGVNKNKIIKINDNKNTYNNILTMDMLLSEKEIQGINLITSPYHTYRSKMIWQKNSNIKLNIIQNLDNPLNYKYAEKKLSYTKIKVIFYEFISLIYNKFLGNSN
ncbi:glycosyltransferase [Candidatus Pelagibacter sp.]|nr:glycosyltransferase [Candidatus Pelagibacter sp.]